MLDDGWLNEEEVSDKTRRAREVVKFVTALLPVNVLDRDAIEVEERVRGIVFVVEEEEEEVVAETPTRRAAGRECFEVEGTVVGVAFERARLERLDIERVMVEGSRDDVCCPSRASCATVGSEGRLDEDAIYSFGRSAAVLSVARESVCCYAP